MNEESLNNIPYKHHDQQHQQLHVMATPTKPQPNDPIDSFLYSPEADSQFFANTNTTFLSSMTSPNRVALSSSIPLIGEQYAGMLPSKARIISQKRLEENHHHEEHLSNEYKSLNDYVSSVEPTLFDLANSSL